MAGRFLLIDVGCLDCGYSTSAVGRFQTEDAARAAATGRVRGPFAVGDEDGPESETWGGSAVAVIFDLGDDQ